MVPCSCLYVNGKGCADAERPIDIDPFTWYFVTKQIEGSICCYSQQMLIIADLEEQKALVPHIVKSGIDGIVSDHGNEEIDRIVLSVQADSDCLLMHQRGFYALSSKGQFYLTGSLLMMPSKSVTAVIGLSKENTHCMVQGCEVCGKQDCSFRRN